MYIKSLQITGFKSFLDKTSFVFKPGITGIVGPNGCGKSNVVDALRWVMGEQSPRHLRGKGMQDVIFAGSEGFAAVGMAEVSLVFDTSDGSAPALFADFPEVEITRRLYRTGESEYLINKTSCRLRDIQDFFRDTGIGTKGYTIVEQGQIAEIVSARPEERRGLIEEAAGISKYKARRHEAELKLRGTSENLLRVDDILGELRRQKNYLERQAKKAVRFKRLQAVHRELDLSLCFEEYQELRDQLHTGGVQLEGIRSHGTGLEARIAERELALERLRVELVQAERALSQRNEALFALRSQIKESEGRIEFEKRECAGLLQANENRSEEIDGLRVQLLEGEREVRVLAEELAGVEADLGRETELLEAAEQEAAGALANLRALEGVRAGLNKTLVERLTAVAGIENRISGSEDRRCDLSDRLGALIAVAEGHREEAASVEEAIAGFATRHAALVGERDRLGEALRASKAACEIASDALRVASEKLRVHRTQRDGRKARFQSLGDLLARGQDVGSAARHLLQRGEEGKRAFGIRALVRDVLEANSSVERAVEAILAERADALVLSGEGNPLNAIRALREAEVGRGVFIIESETSSVPGTSAEGELPGRLLRDLVRPKEGFEATADALLRGVRFVDDLEPVLGRYRGRAIPAVFVSKQGDILTPEGVVKGGGEDVGAGMLARVRELRELEQEVTELDRVLQDSEAAHCSAESQLVSVQAQLEELRQKHHAAELEVAGCERDLVQARERRRALSLTEERREREREELQLEAQKVEILLEDLAEKLRSLRLEQTRCETELEALESKIEEALSRSALCGERVTQCKVDRAGRVEKRDRLRSSRDRAQAAVVDRRQWVARREAEICEAEQRMHALQISSAEAETRVNELLAEEERASTGQEAQRAAFERRSQELHVIETEARDLRSERAALGEKIQAETLKLQELELRAQHLIESTREKWSVSLENWQPSCMETEVVEEDGASTGDVSETGPRAGGTEDLRALSVEERKVRLADVRRKLETLGEVNTAAIEEHEELRERFRFLSEQKEDLEHTIESLREAIARINRKSRKRFRETFEAVNERFKETFPRLFNGGRAELVLLEAEDILEAGIDISAMPPGKRPQSVGLLSGGEKTMTAIALLVALFQVHASPFFLLDEVDAALDDANVGRFNEIVSEMAQGSQFLVITHNKRTVELADVLYGVTMEKKGVSKLVSVELT